MVDWPGLLKWSLKFQDSTDKKSDFKPMDEETKKWLAEALESASLDHVKKLKEIIKDLPTSVSAEVLLEDLSDLIENLDAGLVFCQLGGMPILVNVICKHKEKKVRLLAAQIFQSIVQNSKENQTFALQSGGFQLIENILNEQEISNKEATFSALSAMIRGESLEIKRIFVDIDGLELLKKFTQEYSFSDKIQQKTIFLLKDLVYYDENLNQISFNKADLAEGCEKYKGIVKNKILENGKFLNLFKEKLEDHAKKNIEIRIAIAFILGELSKKYKKDLLSTNNIKWLDVFEEHLKEIVKENQKSDGIYDNEIIVFKNLIESF